VNLFEFESTTRLSSIQELETYVTKQQTPNRIYNSQAEEEKKLIREKGKEKKSVFQRSSVRNRRRGSRRQLGWEVALFLMPLRSKMPRGDRQAICRK
jgi:hypothetical protein